ncbi:MAG: hypothetical protein SGARI_007854, partial [Bacillariaceae sp.]
MLGVVGCGGAVATEKERAKLNAIIVRWENLEAAATKAREEEEMTMNWKQSLEEEECTEDDDDACNAYWDDSNKFVPKHSAVESVAVFGGDPARRRQIVEKKLAPFQSLDQFGSPRDVGFSDTSKLLRKIAAGKYDV